MSPAARRRLVAGLVLVAGSLGLSVAASWPLALWSGLVFPSSPDMPDLNVSLWLPGHLLDALAAGHSPFDAPKLQHPHGQRIALLVWNLGIQVIQAPFYLVAGPLRAYNLSLVALGAGNALGGAMLGASMAPAERRGAAALAGAALLVASPFAWNELVQGRPEQGFLGPMAAAVAGLVSLGTAPRRGRAVATGLAWALAGLCYWFYGYFLARVALPLLAWRALRRDRPGATALATAAAVAALVAAPAALALIAEAAGAGSAYRSSTQSDAAQAAMLQGVQAMASLGIHGLAGGAVWAPTLLRDVLPWASVLAVGAALLPRLGGRARWLAPLALAGLVLALGPQLQATPGHPVQLAGGATVRMPLAALQQVVPGFSRLWWPYRFQVFWALGAAGGAGALVAALAGARRRWLLAVGLALLALGELRLAQQRTSGGLLWDAPQRAVVSPLFSRLAAAPDRAPVLFLPYQSPTTGRVMWQLWHRQPVSIGLGDSDDLLVAPEVRAAVAADPVLAWLKAQGRRTTSAAPPLEGAALIAHLRGLGYHTAVLWRSPPQPGQDVLYRRLFGRAPDHEDAVLSAWQLDP